MRTRTLLLSAAAGALLAPAVGTGTALARPAAVDPALPTTPTVVEPGGVSLSPASARPGQTVQVSGTCPEPQAGAPMPTVQAVISPAFAGPESLTKTDPPAFAGTDGPTERFRR